jgi:hypothetical protein
MRESGLVMWSATKKIQEERLSVESPSEWAEWPDPDVDVDDEAFAAAIARGRDLEAAA